MNEPTPEYDSAADTWKHIQTVREAFIDVAANLSQRSLIHDQSKLEEPEKSAFDRVTPKLKALTYGSEEYKACLREIKPALSHHYQQNDHHPEHYQEGIVSMSLLSIIEMLCDWRAAGLRHEPPTGLMNSIAYNATRFDIPPYLTQILYNTARELGWK
jgi:hypothetical protein